MLFIIYLGWWLAYNGLDIAALLLWIVYGSFIVVVFIFSFLWLDSQHPQQNTTNTFRPNFLPATIIFIICIFFTATYSNYNITYFLAVWWINYYEALNWHNSEEIECLGWVLYADNIFTLLILSSLLSIACIVAVALIIAGKKTKWTTLLRHLKLRNTSTALITTAIRKQHAYQQEKNIFFRLNKIQKGYHRRRT